MSRPAPSTSQELRLDLQGLRTLAVGLVIIYHLFPGRLSGGFVGVDIFLVVSGYLIVGSLIRNLTKTGTVDLPTFYARRIRRLLPASTVVLLTVVLATVIVLPQSRWQDVARDVAASALQVQNWNQAFGSASYESAGALVSPVQHFWSLAVEEQFYLVVPLLLLLAVLCGRGLKLDAKKASLGFLVVLAAASFVHSAIFSTQSHDIAYFATSTRIWELALGGITALVIGSMRLTPLSQLAAGWLGLATVLASAMYFQTSMAFPGFVALAPVVGTILIIVAGVPVKDGSVLNPLGFSNVLSLRPMTYIGDISYSLYLWHWPVIVFYILIKGHVPGVLGGAGILVLSLLLASLSFHQVEQRFRFGKQAVQRGGRRFRPRVCNGTAYTLGVSLVVMSLIAAAGPWVTVQVKALQGFAQSQMALPAYPGAMAFDSTRPAAVPADMPIIPDPAIAIKDVPLTNKNGCAVYDPTKIADSQCRYGNPSGSKKIVLIGDSHASQYADPLAAAAAKNGWQVRAMVRNGCPFSASPPASATTTYSNCSSQNKVSLKKILKLKPERVVVAGMTPYGYKKALQWGWSSNESLTDGYIQMLSPLMDAGIQVSVIADTPYPETSIPDCVDKNGSGSAKCSTALKPVNDPLVRAAQKIEGVQIIDLNTYICRNGVCPPVIGNVLVFRDNHLTATFARTLEYPLAKALNLR
ncbi:acyltransferase family protein [Arthrobacter sp. TMP15]|uniref:acyltransferase family protein n=1 Tax=Arthrobacter sp. TMP15 TaxID=3140789 RepID=UPI0031BA23C0